MEVLSFLKFRKPISSNMKENLSCSGSCEAIDVSSVVFCSEGELEEGDDSFFELELTVSDFDHKKNSDSNEECNRFDSNEEQQLVHCSTKNAVQGELMMSQQQQTAISSMSSNDVLSKRKILPIEMSSKPESPIALLKSAPKLQVSIFKKSKSMATTVKAEKTETSKRGNKLFTKLFTVKFKVEEVSRLSMFSRVSSLRKTQHRDSADESASSLSSSSFDHSSKRFSKDVIQKYLKLIKPLYVKVSKKNDKMRFSGLSEASRAASPATLPVQPPKKENQGNLSSGFRVVSRHLVKSRSASGEAAAFLPGRRDDSLLLQHDGIQSAILHCKNSLNSRDFSSLSRSTSSSSQEIYSNLSTRDSSLLSRFSSDSSSSDFTSARKSNAEEI